MVKININFFFQCTVSSYECHDCSEKSTPEINLSASESERAFG